VQCDQLSQNHPFAKKEEEKVSLPSCRVALELQFTIICLKSDVLVSNSRKRSLASNYAQFEEKRSYVSSTFGLEQIEYNSSISYIL